MTYRTTLRDISANENVRIKEVRVKGQVRRRMLDMGFIDGAEITCMFKGAAGEPTAFLINGTVVALRSEEMRLIEVARAEEVQSEVELSGCRGWA